MSEAIPPHFEKLKDYLRAISPLSDEAIEMISPEIEFRVVAKGEILQRAHEVCQNVYMVKSGILRNFMVDHDQEITRWFAVEGDVFTSMMSFWDGSPTLSSVEAVTKCEVWQVSLKTARALMDNSEEWRGWLLKMLVEGIAVTERRDYRFISTDAYTRFTNLADYRTPEFMNKVPLSVLASYLRITPRTLTRCRNRYIKEKKGT